MSKISALKNLGTLDLSSLPRQDANTSFLPYLLGFFRDFFALISETTAGITQEQSGFKRAAGGSDVQDKNAAKAQETSDMLVNFLREQAVEAKKMGGSLGESIYREAQYIMVVFADEVFLNLLQWGGYTFWCNHLLEQRIFGTHIGGEAFFKNLDRFLALNEPIRRDLGFVYLNALGLGFRGRYRGFNDQGKIAEYKNRLYTNLFGHKPNDLGTGLPIFPQSTSFNLSQPLSKLFFKSARRWPILFMSSALIFLVFSYAAWYGLTYSLHRTADTILEDVNVLGDMDDPTSSP